MALQQLGVIFNAPVGTPESDEADILSLLVEDYEKKHYPIEPPDPIEAIIIRMEEMHLRQRDLVGIFGGKNRVYHGSQLPIPVTLAKIRWLTNPTFFVICQPLKKIIDRKAITFPTLPD